MGHSKKKREEAALTHCLVARRGFRYQFQKQNIPSRSHNSRYKVAPPRILFALQRPEWSACTRRRIPSLLARCNGEKIVPRVRQSIVRFNTLSRYHIPPSLSLSPFLGHSPQYPNPIINTWLLVYATASHWTGHSLILDY